MKKYFVKFLPTSGEIQDGDLIQYKYYDPVSGEWAERQTTRHNAVGRLALLKNGIELTKVIPHLCSRDIQVGDEVWIPPNPKRFIKFPEHAKEFLEEVKSREEGWYKIIGPLSSSAIWITEGMELDEDDVSFVWNGGEDGRGVWKIKCPTCKTFH